MLIYSVLGRYIGVKREGVRWLVSCVDLTERKSSRPYDIIIPSETPEGVISGWLDDLFHEAAIACYPGM